MIDYKSERNKFRKQQMIKDYNLKGFEIRYKVADKESLKAAQRFRHKPYSVPGKQAQDD